MRVGRTLGWLTLVAGLTTWYATRESKRRRGGQMRTENIDRTRWETDGGATAGGPQPPGAQTGNAPF